MRILITGIKGYIGSYLSKYLYENEYEIYGLDIIDNINIDIDIRDKGIIKNEIYIEKIDLRNKYNTLEFFRKVKPNLVIHLAASIQVGESEMLPLEYYENNICSMIHVLEAMKECQCKYLLFASTAAVYETSNSFLTENSMLGPSSVYGRTKLMCEQIIQDAYEKNILEKVIMFRFFNVMGGHIPSHCVHLFPILLYNFREQTPINVFGNDYDTPDGTCVRDYISLQDLSRAHLLSIKLFLENKKERMCESINLGTSHGYSVMEVIDAFFKETLMLLPINIVGKRNGDPAILVASNQKAKIILNWEPVNTITDSIKQLLLFSKKIV